jgi:hypothetical protein
LHCKIRLAEAAREILLSASCKSANRILQCK